MIDAAGVKHFLNTSVERGGNEASWHNPVPSVTDYTCKHKIEQHLRSSAESSMAWTILRPVALMDHIKPCETKSKLFIAALKSELKDTKLQWVAARDMGFFARLALDNPNEFNGSAMGLAGDQLGVPEVIKKTKETTGQSLEPKMIGVGLMSKTIMGQLGGKMAWMRTEGYKADLAECRKMIPGMLTFEAWLAQESGFAK